MSPLVVVCIAALATTLFGLAWTLASHVWGAVSERRWDEGLDA